MILEVGNKSKPSYLDILYRITLKCNLNCDYCIQHDNSVNETYSNILDTVHFINSVSEVKTKTHVTIIGGEPTCSNLELFLLHLHEKVSVELHTNLTRDVEYYKKIKDLHKNITFTASWHSKSLKLYSCEDFINKCNLIENMKIFIMFDPRYSSLCYKLFNILNKQHEVEIHKIYSEDNKYNISNSDFLKIDSLLTQNIDLEKIRYKFSNGNEKYFDSETIKKLNFNNFKDYKCSAGDSCLAIDHDGKIYPCLTYLINKECEINKKDFMFNNTICKYKKCLCELDVYKCLN